MLSAEPAAAVLWCIEDARPGHRNQLRGLLRRIEAVAPVHVHTIAIQSRAVAWWRWLTGRFPEGKDLPDPDLILGAGHGTHPAVLAARRARGGRAVILMRPSLPVRWFDLCLVPEHDGLRAGENIILTRGAINTVVPSGQQAADRGLILLGGPSSHHGWDDAAMVGQVRAVVTAEPGRKWKLTTSRRTPADIVPALRALPADNLEVIPVDQTEPGWVGRELEQASAVWVSEDSVSMVYEALTSGAAVGVLAVPRRGTGRVVRGLDQLVSEGWVTTFDAWQEGQALQPPPTPLFEADRCARIICERWLCPRGGCR